MIKRDIVFSYLNDALLQATPYFTLKRCPDDFPKPPYNHGHHPYFLDYTVPIISKKEGILSTNYRSDKKPKIEDYQIVEVEDEQAQVDATSKRYREILTLVNTFSGGYFFNYDNQEGWFLARDDNHKMHYGQMFYRSPEQVKQPEMFDELPYYAFVDPEYFRISLSGTKIFPIGFKKLIEVYYTNNDEEFKSAYLNAALVFNKSLQIRKIDHSASYLMMVSAIEALIQIEYKDQEVEKCSSCEQKIYKATEKFRKFLNDYGFETDKKIKNKFYDLRSRISHDGTLLGMSYDSKWIIENQEDLDKDYQRYIDRLYYERFEKLAKTCFRYFLIIKTGYLDDLLEQHSHK